MFCQASCNFGCTAAGGSGGNSPGAKVWGRLSGVAFGITDDGKAPTTEPGFRELESAACVGSVPHTVTNAATLKAAVMDGKRMTPDLFCARGWGNQGREVFTALLGPTIQKSAAVTFSTNRLSSFPFF